MATHKIKIIARLRPRIANEVDDKAIQVSPDGKCITLPNPRNVTEVFKYPFANCYGQDSTQEELFTNDVRPVINLAFEGVTVTCFCYGVTSSGKTHTMQGNPSQPGVIPRTVQALFANRNSLYPDAEISVSYMEIYKDEVYDLLVNREKANKLPVRENDAGQVFVANLSTLPIASEGDFMDIYSHANKQRSVGATNLNRESSRSHAILTLHVVLHLRSQNKVLSGKINLVDLAGSENNKITGNDATRMVESAAINKSLSVLGQVVHALNQGASRIPYRNSKLTRILQDALGGSSVGILICNLAPGTKFRQDTLNTLNFAVRTKNIENKPVVNEKDTKPAPRPHFAAVQAPPPSLPPAVIPSLEAKVAPAAPPAIQPRVSKVPRPSGFGIAGPRPSTAIPLASGRSSSYLDDSPPPSASGSLNLLNMLTAEEIDQRIAKAVEAEVARRMAEVEKVEQERRERERKEEERRQREWEEKTRELGEVSRSRRHRSRSISPSKELRTLPHGVVTPLLKRRAHPSHTENLQQDLYELEESLEDQAGDSVPPEEILSPSSRKKTGRAYVALARAHSEKGDLIQALVLYKKALQFVPDNKKLQDRILDVEYAVKHGTPFISSPKKAGAKPRRSKSAPVKDRTPPPEEEVEDEEAEEMEQVVEEISVHLDRESSPLPMDNRRSKRIAATRFGRERTNGKRSMSNGARTDGDENRGTPPKKQRKGGRLAPGDESSDDGYVQRGRVF